MNAAAAEGSSPALPSALAPRLISLQLLRGFAAALVAAYHFVPHWHLVAPAAPAAMLRWFGFWGIDVFFVLSGFVMWWTTATPERAGPRTFLVKRVLRIYPAYWLVIVAICLMRFALPANLLSTALLLPQPLADMPLPVAWTLSFEVLFYVTFAIMLCGCPDPARRLSAARVLVAGIALTCAALWLAGAWTKEGFFALRAALGSSVASEVLQMVASPFQLEFWAGALLAAHARTRQRPHDATPAHLVTMAVGVVAMIALAVVVSVVGFGEDLNQGYYALQHVLWFGPPACLLVVLCVRGENWSAQWARRRGGRAWHWIGDGSYSVYLLHTPLYELIFRLGWRDLAAAGGWLGAVAFLLLLPATVLVSAAFGNAVELPLYRAARRAWAWLSAGSSLSAGASLNRDERR